MIDHSLPVPRPRESLTIAALPEALRASSRSSVAYVPPVKRLATGLIWLDCKPDISALCGRMFVSYGSGSFLCMLFDAYDRAGKSLEEIWTDHIVFIVLFIDTSEYVRSLSQLRHVFPMRT